MSAIRLGFLLGAILVASAVAQKDGKMMKPKRNQDAEDKTPAICDKLTEGCSPMDSDCIKENLESLIPQLNTTDRVKNMMSCFGKFKDGPFDFDMSKMVRKEWLARRGKGMRRKTGDTVDEEAEEGFDPSTEGLGRPKMGRRRGGKHRMFGRDKHRKGMKEGKKEKKEGKMDETEVEEVEDEDITPFMGKRRGMKAGKQRGRSGLGKQQKGWRKHKHDAMKNTKDAKKQLKALKKANAHAEKKARKSSKKAHRGERRQHMREEKKGQKERGMGRKGSKGEGSKEVTPMTPPTPVGPLTGLDDEKDLTKWMGKSTEEKMEKPEPIASMPES